MPLPELRAHPFDPSDGLDMTEVAMLAVVNNPDLVLARDDAGISDAQAFSAGLLPDPQIGLTRDFPDIGGPGTSSAFNLGLSYGINALINYSATSAAAKAEARKTDLTLLWQEWQVVAKARVLFVRLTKEAQLMDVLRQNRTLFADRYEHTQMALDRGLLTLDAVTPHLAALQDVNRQMNDLERQMSQNRHDLNALLGLAPEVDVPLTGIAELPVLDEAQVLALLSQLPGRRPDLIALQAGYEAQDQRYRAAILSQFPALNIGVNRARDTSNTYTRGFAISLTLPVWNRGRGDIAVALATRQRLYDEYQQRLNGAGSDVHRILDEQRINARQLQQVDAGSADLAQAAIKAQAAFTARNIDALAFTNLEASLLAKEIEKINLEQAILEQQVALQTLVGGELPIQRMQ